MKKLLLLILLLTSFTAQALSIIMPTPCIDKFFMKLLEDELEELTKLSNSDKDNLTYKNQLMNFEQTYMSWLAVSAEKAQKEILSMKRGRVFGLGMMNTTIQPSLEIIKMA